MFTLEMEMLETGELLLTIHVTVAEVHTGMYIRVATNYIAFGYHIKSSGVSLSC